MCTCTDGNYYFTGGTCVPYFSYGVSGTAPWGIYRAQGYSSTLSKLVEARGNGRDVTSTGTITSSSGTGNGAVNSVASISGGTSSTLTWVSSMPVDFTICSITRYTGGANERVLTGSGSANWLHGHWGGLRGVAYYNGWKTQRILSVGTLTDWLVMCGQSSDSSDSAPYNILADGT